MALVVIIVVAWVVILIPGFLRRRSASDATDSISHFHQQLRILEHSAPKPIVAPAYRLAGRRRRRPGARCRGHGGARPRSPWSAPATCPARRSPSWPMTRPRRPGLAGLRTRGR